MPPALALLPLVASGLGSAALPGLAGFLGADLGGAGLLGATLGETLGTAGGALGGAAAGGLTDKKDPLKGALLGGVTGALGGPNLASGAEAVGTSIGDVLGSGASAGSGVGAGLGAGAGGLTAPAAATTAGTGLGAAAQAAPSSVSPTPAPGTTQTSLDAPTSPIATPAAPTGGSTSLDTALGFGGKQPGASLSNASGPVGSTGAPGPTPAAAAPAAAPAGTETSLDALLKDPSLKNFGHVLGANKDLLGPALGLGYDAIAGQKPLPGEAQIAQQAKRLAAGGSTLQGYAQTGQLPPGMEAGLRGATQAAKASMRSLFAQHGMSGSSSEVEALASIDLQAAEKGGEMATSLLQQGIQESQLSTALYQQIMQNALAQDESLAKAIGGFASALVPPATVH